MAPVESSRDAGAPYEMKIAVVGGGRRCLSLLQVLASHVLEGLKVEIVGVADIDPEAVGFRYARETGVYTTQDHRRLFRLPGLDLIINLTGSQDLSRDLAENAPAHISVLPHQASRLFQEFVQNVLTASRRMAEQADEISRYHSFAQAMAKATIVGVMVLDTQYHINWVNEVALQMAGSTREEVLGRYCFQVSHQQIGPCCSPDTPCPMKETLDTGRAAHAIHEHRNPSGQTTYCDVSTFPLFNQKGEVVEVVEVIRDITADMNEKLERRTRALKDDLARLVQEDKLIALGKLVASVAHEVNNPIAAIINFTKLIKESLGEGLLSREQLASYDKYLEMTIREAQRCGKIVSNLLSFSRQQTVEPKTIDLAEILDRIIALVSHKLRLADVELVKEVETKPLEVWGDYIQLQQCLLNLVFNAMEAMPQGGRLTLRGGLAEEAGQVWIAVQDTGVGIAPEHLGSIFEPFFTTKSEGHGVGLGLSMVYGIIREHRGDISVQSMEGLGTTFRITLPASPAGQQGGPVHE
ncbi:MAG: ATP-binding protein [Thermodesulfobacteriota bacterium]